MAINHKNFEIYFTDHMDGNLSPAEEKELKAFLLVNPDLAQQTEGMEEVRLEAPEIRFPRKDLLKRKEEAEECPDYEAIACAENVLTAQEKARLGRKYEAPDFRVLVQVYKQTRLKPDLSIRFEKKSGLYRKNRFYPFLLRSAGIAASLALLVSLGLFFFRMSRQEIVTTSPLPERSHPLLVQETNIAPLTSPEVVLPARIRYEKKVLPQHSFQIRTLPEMPLTASSIYYESVETTPLPEITVNHSPEIVLNEKAREWKPSTDSFQSKNIISSMIQAGKNLAERKRNEEGSFVP